MKVFSLWQPWASIWLAGAPIGKGIETRAKQTDYRGVVAVHAALHFDEITMALCYEEPFQSALAALGFDTFSMLPRGKVLGTVVLTDCLRMDLEPGPGLISLPDDPRLTERERAFGNYMAGRVAWITAPEPRVRLAAPIPMRGSQWLQDLPWDVAEKMARAATAPMFAAPAPAAAAGSAG